MGWLTMLSRTGVCSPLAVGRTPSFLRGRRSIVTAQVEATERPESEPTTATIRGTDRRSMVDDERPISTGFEDRESASRAFGPRRAVGPKRYVHGARIGDMSRSATAAFLRLFSYVALAVGVLAALNGTRLLVGLLFWPASAPPWVLPAFNLGVATLAIDGPVRHREPEHVRGKSSGPGQVEAVVTAAVARRRHRTRATSVSPCRRRRVPRRRGPGRGSAPVRPRGRLPPGSGRGSAGSEAPRRSGR